MTNANAHCRDERGAKGSFFVYVFDGVKLLVS